MQLQCSICGIHEQICGLLPLARPVYSIKTVKAAPRCLLPSTRRRRSSKSSSCSSNSGAPIPTQPSPSPGPAPSGGHLQQKRNDELGQPERISSFSEGHLLPYGMIQRWTPVLDAFSCFLTRIWGLVADRRRLLAATPSLLELRKAHFYHQTLRVLRLLEEENIKKTIGGYSISSERKGEEHVCAVCRLLLAVSQGIP